MKFRTEIEIVPVLGFAPHSNHLAIGSCFATGVIGNLQALGLPLLFNPFGISFHPQAICQQLRFLNSDRSYGQTDLIRFQENYVSLDFHGSFCRPDAAAALKAINTSVESARNHLRNCESLILTFGTAFRYVDQETGRVANNCHKLPPERFKRELVLAEDLYTDLAQVIAELRQSTPNLRIITTVSPVRHLRDNPVANQVSKAQLITLCHFLESKVSDTAYFPAYELQLDELRDYRFYQEDMVHPSSQAQLFITEKFLEFFYNPHLTSYRKQADKLCKRLSHRVVNPDSEAAAGFQRDTAAMMEAFTQQYPWTWLNRRPPE